MKLVSSISVPEEEGKKKKKKLPSPVTFILQFFTKRKLSPSKRKLLPQAPTTKMSPMMVPGDGELPLDTTNKLLVQGENSKDSPQERTEADAGTSCSCQDDPNTRMHTPVLVARLMGLDSVPVAQCERLPTKESNSKLTDSQKDYYNLHLKSSPIFDSEGPQLQKSLSPSTESRQIVSSQFGPEMNQSPSSKYQDKLLSPAKSNVLMEPTAKVLGRGTQLRSRSVSPNTRLGSLQVSRGSNGAAIFQKTSAEGSRDSLVGVCSSSFKDLGEAGKQLLGGEDKNESVCIEPKTSNVSSPLKGLEDYHKFRSQVTVAALVPVQDRGNQWSSYTSVDRNGAASSDVAAKNNVLRRTHKNVGVKNDVRSNQLRNKHQENALSDYPLKQSNLKKKKSPLANENIFTSRQSRVQEQFPRNEAKDLVYRKKTLNNDSSIRSKLKASNRVVAERVGLENKSMVKNGRSTINPARQRAVGKDLIIRRGAGLFSECPISPRSPRRNLWKQSELGEDKMDITCIVSFTFSSPMKRASRSLSIKVNAEKGRSIADSTSSASRSEMTFGRVATGPLTKMKGSELDQTGGGWPSETTQTDCMNYESKNLADCIHCVKLRCANAKFHGDTKTGIAAVFARGDGDYRSPISTLQDSFMYDNDCFSRSSSGTPESQPDMDLKGRQLSKTELKILEVGLSDSAHPMSTRKLNARNKLISNRLCNKKHCISTFDVEIQKSRLRCSAEVMSHAELLLQNTSPIDSDGRNASSTSLFLHETMESIFAAISMNLRGNFTEAKDGGWVRNLVIDSTVECLASIYNQLCNSGCRLWFKLLSFCTKDSLVAEIVKEVVGWYFVAGKPWESLVVSDFDRSTEMWKDFWFHACQTGMQIENDILQLLINELVVDLLHC